jgi:hypothetical protein
MNGSQSLSRETTRRVTRRSMTFPHTAMEEIGTGGFNAAAKNH